MKPIGGEAELQKIPEFVYYTDSGRSSLRLILSSLKGKKIALPNYLCSTISEVLDQESVSYEFYQVRNDLRIDLVSLPNDFDVLYIINYFGIQHSYLADEVFLGSKIIIEDNVFSPFVENTCMFKNWISYNSFRKFSACAEGSLVKSSIRLEESLIQKREAPFVEKKYLAKSMKYDWLKYSLYSEEEYLNQFQQAEAQLDKQRHIYGLSNRGFHHVSEFYKNLYEEKKTRELNYNFMASEIKESIYFQSSFYSFFILKLENRDSVRKACFESGIFLPAHWPNTNQLRNVLYDQSLSIPIDSRYNQDDLRRIINIVNK